LRRPAGGAPAATRHDHVPEIHLTDEGRARLADADADVNALEADLVDHLGADAANRLGALLSQVVSLTQDR